MCFYWKRDSDDIAVVGAYADDLLAAKTNTAAVDQLYNILASLSIEELVRVSKFLGMRATLHDDRGYTIDQESRLAISSVPTDSQMHTRRALRLVTTAMA